MDIYSKGEYPSGALSNFSEHHFVLNGITCYSMEGFLQSLKYRRAKCRRRICRLVGKEAKAAGGRRRLWRLTGTLHWNGRRIKRRSSAFQELLTQAYDALFFQCEEFRLALFATQEEPLTHSIGQSDPRKTILTEEEFVGQLLRLRAKHR